MTITAWVLVLFYLEGGVMVGETLLTVPTYQECITVKQSVPPPPEGAQLICWPQTEQGAKARPAGV